MNLGTRNHSTLAALGGLVASTAITLGVFGSIALLFQSSGSTQWVSADRAQVIEHCADRLSPSSRHACIRATHAASRIDARVAAGNPAAANSEQAY